MPFEDPKFIYELLVVNPADTDQRSQGALTMRGIKNAIVGTGTVDAGSFTPNATGQYTGTMDEIQFAADNAIPTDDTTTPPVNGDVLTFDGTDWVPGVAASTAVYASTYIEYADNLNGEIWFLTANEGIDGSGVATVKNDGLLGRGWLLTALVRCHAVVSYDITNQLTSANNIDSGAKTITRDIAGIPYLLAFGRQSIDTQSNSSMKRVSVNLTASAILEVGETISLTSGDNTNIPNSSSTVTVQAIA
jgi:hypothetical protein